MKKEIIILIGPAAIGKTTYIKGAGFNQEKLAIISRDDIVDKICDHYKLTYDEMFYFPPKDSVLGELVPGFEKYGHVIISPDACKHVSLLSYNTLNDINTEVYNTFYEDFEKATNNPNIQHVVVDRVHLRQDERALYFPYLQKNREDFIVKAILFNFQDPDALDVISKVSEIRKKEIEKTGRKKTVPLSVQQRMISFYVEPTLEEGFDEIIKIDTLPFLRKFLKTNS